LQPPKVLVTIFPGDPGPCKIGQKATVQIQAPAVVAGEVVEVRAGKEQSSKSCEIRLSTPVPEGIAIGNEVGALVEIGAMVDVVFFTRPADSSANSDSNVFRIEANGNFAQRVKVRYGQISGPLIQVVAGLSPGDQVIITDMSKWKDSERVR